MIKQWMKCAALSVALAVASPLALAQGSKAFEPTTQLAGQTLQLNGQGVRYRAIIPVYEMALYTPKKVTTPEQLLGLPGPKRVSFVALRDVPGDQLGIALVRGMSENADPGHKAQIAGFMDKLGRIFSTEKKIAAGQAFALEHVPGKGTVFLINGVQKGETVTDAGFIEAVLRIWVGPKPVDSHLKSSLLGAPPKKVDTNNLG